MAKGTRAKNPSRWSRFKTAMIRTDREFAVFKGLTFVSVVSTILVAYFQYISAYEEKVATQYKEDFAAATKAFTEISSAFASAQILQQQLYFNYADVAGTDLETNSKVMQVKSAHEFYKSYNDTRTKLRQTVDALAREAEMQIDWASDTTRDPAAPRTINADPLSRAELGAYNFNCDLKEYMPKFSARKPDPDSGKQTKPEKPKKCDQQSAKKDVDKDHPYVEICAFDDNGKAISEKPPLRIDWYSARHHVWTLFYCFDNTHAALTAAREWASESQIDNDARGKFIAKAKKKVIQDALDSQVLRLQAFMSLAMLRLENIRVKYRPHGFACHVPILRELLDAANHRCSPVRTAVN